MLYYYLLKQYKRMRELSTDPLPCQQAVCILSQVQGHLPVRLFIQFALIVLNALFACIEIAVISLNDAKVQRLADDGDKTARKIMRLTAEPAKFLATIQVGITLTGFLGSAFAADSFAGRLTDWLIGIGMPVPAATLNTISLVFITLVLSFFTLVLGELVPKRIAMKKSESLAMGLTGFIYAFSKIMTPVVGLLTVSTNLILKLFRINPEDNDERVTEEEIRLMVDIGSKSGAIDPQEKAMIQNVFEFDNKTAEDVMTHRTDVEALWLDDSPDVWDNTILMSSHSRFPVCDESIDDIKGILYIKDYYRARAQKPLTAETLREILRPALFLPETLQTDELFESMRKNKTHFAVVLDEYGGVSGIVTMEDLLVEIVGEYSEDEDDEPQTEDVKEIAEGVWRIKGQADLEYVAETLRLSLPTEEYNTFGGMVFGEMGAIPDDGETPELTVCGMRVRIDEIRDHRIVTATVELVPAESEPAEANGKA